MVEASGETVNIDAGEQIAYGPGLSVLAPRPADTESATAWRRGTLIFEDKPLGEVIALIDHYHRGYCLIIDPSIRNGLVTGVFRTSGPLQAIRTLELSLGLHVTYLTDYLILLRG
jgi:transmembrane sensor